MKSVSLENVSEQEDVECPCSTAGIKLLSFAPLGRQNGFCIHDSSEDEREIDTDALGNGMLVSGSFTRFL
ncbi:hypothetical protein ACOMHN_004403 [Nucella lapillus]